MPGSPEMWLGRLTGKLRVKGQPEVHCESLSQIMMLIVIIIMAWMEHKFRFTLNK
jgi:hypothetical protein